MQLAYLSDAFCIVLSDFIFQQIRAFHSLFKCSSFSCCSGSHWISRIISPNWAQSFDEENYLLSKTNPEILMHSIHNSIMQVLPFLSHQSYPSSWPILYGNFIHDDWQRFDTTWAYWHIPSWTLQQHWKYTGLVKGKFLLGLHVVLGSSYSH